MTDDGSAAPPDPANPKEQSAFWQMQLALAEREQEAWVRKAREVRDRYRGERNAAHRNDGRRLNILWSNTETLKAALCGRTAKPDIRRRFADQDPAGRQVAEVIERALIYCADSADTDAPVASALEDYLLPGRGIVRVSYEPMIGTQQVIGPDGAMLLQEVITGQEVRERYVFWEDYLQSPARHDGDVWWRAFRLIMTRDELAANFGAAGRDVPLDWSPETGGRRERALPEDLKRAEVWEIWDRRDRTRVFVVKGCDRVLRTDTDPYRLRDFWPMAEPLRSVTTTDSLVPIPEFTLYQDQADELDRLTTRISRLTEALKRRGVYDKSIPELRRLAHAGDNEFIPVDNYASLMQKGGLAKAFDTEDVSRIAVVLVELHRQRDIQVQQIYEVTGIADIMRGASDPAETFGAQEIKTQFGSMRLKRRQRAVQRFIRDTYRIKAELIAEHFEPQVLSEMTGLAVTPQMIAILRSDRLRSYRMDVETDSTVFEDATAEKRARVEVLTAVAGFLRESMPAVQQAPEMAPLLFEMLAFGVRTFKAGRALEDTIDQTRDAIMRRIASAQQAAQQPAPQQALPEALMQVEQARAERTRAEQQGRTAMMGMQVQAKAAEHAMEMEKLALEAQANRERAALAAMRPQGRG